MINEIITQAVAKVWKYYHMECKYFYRRDESKPVIGGSPLHITESLCLLKTRDLQTKFSIYNTLFEKGLQGSMFTDDCPIANSNSWKECPFYEAQET